VRWRSSPNKAPGGDSTQPGLHDASRDSTHGKTTGHRPLLDILGFVDAGTRRAPDHLPLPSAEIVGTRYAKVARQTAALVTK
ncbi:MAG: hypothetical protein WCP28_19570, partial [Actinomycetes bacterium]